jgi:hypothetical protein
MIKSRKEASAVAAVPEVEPEAERPKADGAALLNDVHAFLGRFIAYPSEHTHVAHALWIVHTHAMDAWESTPRIAFSSTVAGRVGSRTQAS